MPSDSAGTKLNNAPQAVPDSLTPKILGETTRHYFCKQGRDSITDQQRTLCLCSTERKRIRERLQTGTFPQRQEPVFGRMHELANSPRP